MRLKWLWIEKPHNLILQWSFTGKSPRLAFQIQSSVSQLCLKWTDLSMSFLQLIYKLIRSNIYLLLAENSIKVKKKRSSNHQPTVQHKSKPYMWWDPHVIVRVLQDSLMTPTVASKSSRRLWRREGLCMKCQKEGAEGSELGLWLWSSDTCELGILNPLYNVQSWFFLT